VELTQRYHNFSKTFLEAEYFFPVLTNACFTNFSAEFDGKIVRGVVKEKVEARQEYQ
jgi:Ca-activated chloride channel family protein